MSLRHEQYVALREAKELLHWLIITTPAPRITEIRARARAALRHYPALYPSGQPIWSRDNYTQDAEHDGWSRDEFTEEV